MIQLFFASQLKILKYKHNFFLKLSIELHNFFKKNNLEGYIFPQDEFSDRIHSVSKRRLPVKMRFFDRETLSQTRCSFFSKRNLKSLK